MSDFNPYQPPSVAATLEAPPAAIVPPSRDIGGWLILLAIGTVISPFRLALEVFRNYSAGMADGSWTRMTTPGYEAYHPMWQPILVGEVFFNVLCILLRFYILYLFFSKKSSLPAWYASVTCFTLVFLFIDSVVVGWVRPDLPMFDTQTTMELSKNLVSGILWVWYLFASERARETFTR